MNVEFFRENPLCFLIMKCFQACAISSKARNSKNPKIQEKRAKQQRLFMKNTMYINFNANQSLRRLSRK